MARKSKKRKSKQPVKKTKRSFLWIGIAITAVVVLLIVSGLIPLSGEKKGKSFYVQGGETRTVLNPSLFTGLANKAYGAAKKYPEIMDQVYCYCSCDEPPFNHKSLLSCFVDRHGAG